MLKLPYSHVHVVSFSKDWTQWENDYSMQSGRAELGSFGQGYIFNWRQIWSSLNVMTLINGSVIGKEIKGYLSVYPAIYQNSLMNLIALTFTLAPVHVPWVVVRDLVLIGRKSVLPNL